MRLIGLTGKKGSGKDTVASIILERVKNSSRLAYGDALKKEVAEATGTSVEYINRNKERFRMILQWWGTEWRRQQNERYWLDIMAAQFANVRHHYPAEHTVIVTDVRFLNEARQITDHGGIIVRVEREDNPFDTEDEHLSENEMKDYRGVYTIKNKGNMVELESEVELFLHATI